MEHTHNQTKNRWVATLVFFAVGAMIVVNYFADFALLGGVTTGDVSRMYPTLITPAGYAFGIWALIYAGVAAFAVWQVFPGADRNPAVRAVRAPILLSAGANIAWVIFWHLQEMALALAAILTLLASLALMYLRLDRIPLESKREWLLVRFPISVYFAWVTVASVVAVAVTLVSLGWKPQPAETILWASAVLALTGLLGASLTKRQGDLPLSLTFIWAFLAIAREQAIFEPVLTGAFFAAGLVVMAMIAVWQERRRHRWAVA